MADPQFPRPFQFDLPLFDVPNGPWRTFVGKTADNNQQQACATYKILCEYSEESLADLRRTLQELIQAGQQTSKKFEITTHKISRAEQALQNGGGFAQFPFVNYDEFSFPIYPVRRDGDRLATVDLPMSPYALPSFEPPWFPRSGNNIEGWKALNVPQPAGPIRPSGAEPDEVPDGTIILFDSQTKIEYDFWQVTPTPDAPDNSEENEHVGMSMLTAGSVTGYATLGVGARHSEADPTASARASGLPYLGGLILPEDFSLGVNSKIDHPLIFCLPRLRYSATPAENSPNWVYPASRTETSHFTPDSNALAAGQRIALNDGNLYGRDGIQHGTQGVLTNPDLPPIVRIFLEALFRYGAYLVDGGGGFGLAAEDIHTADFAATLSHNTNQALDADQVVKDLTGLTELDPTKTHWQIMIETLNSHLAGQTPNSDVPSPLLEGSGLNFAWLDDVHGFRSNFTVIKDLCPT